MHKWAIIWTADLRIAYVMKHELSIQFRLIVAEMIPRWFQSVTLGDPPNILINKSPNDFQTDKEENDKASLRMRIRFTTHGDRR